MVELVEYIAKSLVDHPEQVEVREIQGETGLILELRVAPEDMGKVIGKQGRIAKAILLSMTPRERRNPNLLNFSRKKRIAAGSGTSVQQINQLLRQFEQMQKLMKQFGSMGRRGRRGGFPKLPF